MKTLAFILVVALSGTLNAQDTIIHRITKQQYLDAVAYSKSDLDIKKFESELINLINSHRKSNGLKALELDTNLIKASLIQSDYMVSINKVTHKNSKVGFETMTQRIKYFYKGSYGVSLENACTGSLYLCFRNDNSPAQQIFNLWKDSPGHNQNMLNPKVNKIGLTLSRGPGREYFYATMDAIDTTFNSVVDW
jgi:uncharacterized protein YkwD